VQSLELAACSIFPRKEPPCPHDRLPHRLRPQQADGAHSVEGDSLVSRRAKSPARHGRFPSQNLTAGGWLPHHEETVPRRGPRRASRTDPSNATDQSRVRPRGRTASARSRSVPARPRLRALHCSVSFFSIQRFVILLFVGPSAEVATGGAISRRRRASPAAKGKAPAKVRF
jgi:hypothetical protein